MNLPNQSLRSCAYYDVASEPASGYIFLYLEPDLAQPFPISKFVNKADTSFYSHYQI